MDPCQASAAEGKVPRQKMGRPFYPGDPKKAGILGRSSKKAVV